jgi:hypothetical protein
VQAQNVTNFLFQTCTWDFEKSLFFVVVPSTLQNGK